MKELEGFAEFVHETMAQWQVPGLAIGIVQGDALVYAEGFGCRDVEQQLPVTPNTLFAIGSSSKAFTATLAGIMVDEEKLDWHTPIRKWLPTFELKDRFATERMTLADLLCHRSGLPRHDLVWYNTTATREELLDRLKHLEPSKDFRTFLQYQNLMFLTAGYLAGLVSGTSWEALVEERLFGPLEMTHSNLSVENSQQSTDYALPYSIPDFKANERQQVAFRNIDTIGPAGSINSNVVDMANWLIMNLNGGKFRDRPIISEGALREIHSAQMPLIPAAMMMPPLETHAEVGQASYGFGWFVTQYRGHRWLHHGGSIDGFDAMVSLLPREKIGVVVLSNLGGRMVSNIVACHLNDRLLGLEPLDWSTVWREFYATAMGEVDKANDKLLAARIPDTQPSHPLTDYAGEYVHPGYGALTVVHRDGGLTAFYNSLELALQHYHYDVFLAKSKQNPAYLPATFSTSVDGAISAVAVPLEQAVAPITFTRQPSPAPAAGAEPQPA